jgi:selenoprotein W-related protein
LASLLLENLKQKIESFELIPAGGGCFELTVDGKLIYSKLELGGFPVESEILAQVQAVT